MLALLSILINALQMLIIADVVLSWVRPNPNEFPRKLTTQVTEPLYAPIHAVLNPRATGGFDLAPLIVLLLL
ncbi:MAG: YggT family protein, partial [Myxococcales bacterium]|nr:YggT family protein [Myxococcales bacterium]